MSLDKVAAVCCRPVAGGDVMFLLVRSRGGSRWTFPKGSMEISDPGRAAAAAREALEEAGVTGDVDPQPLGTYRRMRPARKWPEGGVEEEVEAWLLVVTGIRSAGEPGRRPTWLSHAEAAAAFRRNPDDPGYTGQLCAILDAARARLFPAAPSPVESIVPV